MFSTKRTALASTCAFAALAFSVLPSSNANAFFGIFGGNNQTTTVTTPSVTVTTPQVSVPSVPSVGNGNCTQITSAAAASYQCQDTSGGTYYIHFYQQNGAYQYVTTQSATPPATAVTTTAQPATVSTSQTTSTAAFGGNTSTVPCSQITSTGVASYQCQDANGGTFYIHFYEENGEFQYYISQDATNTYGSTTTTAVTTNTVVTNPVTTTVTTPVVTTPIITATAPTSGGSWWNPLSWGGSSSGSQTTTTTVTTPSATVTTPTVTTSATTSSLSSGTTTMRAPLTSNMYGRLQGLLSSGSDVETNQTVTPTTFMFNAKPSLGAGIVGALGKSFGPLAIEGEAAYRHYGVDDVTVGGTSGGAPDGSISALTLMANALYHFNQGGKIQPFVGAGIGAGNVSLKNLSALSGISYADDGGWGLAYQAMVGADVPITPNMSLTGALRYLGINGVNYESATPATANELDFMAPEVSLGFKLDF